MNFSPTDIEIARLHIKAPKNEHRNAITEVEHAAWPQAAQDDWVFIRQIKIHSSRPWLGIRAAALARRLADAAVEGTRPGADRADAVRFRSFNELLACLSIDLAMGRAANVWYWKRWAALLKQPAGDALQDLWSEHIAYLPAVTARIAESGMLPLVWRMLTTQQAILLLVALSRFTGSTLTVIDEVKPVTLAQETVPEIPEYLQLRWRDVIRDLPENDARRSLAVALLVLEWRPLLLTSKPAISLQRISQSLTSPASQRSDPRHSIASSDKDNRIKSDVLRQQTLNESPNKNRPEAEKESSRHGTGNTNQLPSLTKVNTHKPLIKPLNDAKQSSVDRSQQEVNSSISKKQTEGSKIKSLKDNDEFNSYEESGKFKSAKEIDEVLTRDEVSSTREPIDIEIINHEQNDMPRAELELHTTQGGLFYLVNFLNRLEVAELIENNGGMNALLDGWAWLYRLGSELLLQPHGPLALFLAQRMGYENVSQLDLLPPLPARQPLLDLAAQLYGQSEIWNADLLDKPAWIRYSASHLDVYYPLSVASLEVRLAGLDINPGWVPWLGRVVTFFYQETPMMPTGTEP